MSSQLHQFVLLINRGRRLFYAELLTKIIKRGSLHPILLLELVPTLIQRAKHRRCNELRLCTRILRQLMYSISFPLFMPNVARESI